MMDPTERIRTAFERNARALALRPSVGIGTAVTHARLIDGLACEVTEGSWRIVADMGEKSGGTNLGPNPGMLGRAALGSCLAIGYAMWAARSGVKLDALEVEVQADYDASGIYGVSETPARYSQVRCVVTVDSDAPREEVLRVLEAAEAHSPYFDLFRHSVELHREATVRSTGGE